MPFPETERVIYRNNPLHQVICQLRFPPILRIEKETPADFQENIRHTFPEYRIAYDETIGQLPQNISQTLPSEVRELLSPKSNPRYQFLTRDGTWTVSLTRDFVALETQEYVRWEAFREYLELVLNCLMDVYQPVYLTRLGLRYKNVIDRKRLGLQDSAWRELISDFVLGQFAPEETMNRVVEQHGRSLLELNNKGDMVRLEYGLVTDKAADIPRKLYLLDHDFYTNEEIDANDVIRKLEGYNSLNRRLFRWCIQERLHTAMGPELA